LFYAVLVLSGRPNVTVKTLLWQSCKIYNSSHSRVKCYKQNMEVMVQNKVAFFYDSQCIYSACTGRQ